MQVRLFTIPLLSALAGALGCATTPPPPGTVSGFGGCNSCSAAAQLPRGRLVPAPVPLPAGPVYQQPPQAVTPASPPPSARLFTPETEGGQGGTRLIPPRVGERPQSPPAQEQPTGPVDVPGFVVVKKDIATGQKPFTDGVPWLRDRGYRTVLHVRQPGEDDAAARRQFEASGFRYLSLEVSPLTLSKAIVDRFNRLVGDPANLPLFVYDRDSSLLGGLWYLHFRTVEKLPDDKATDAAARLGLNPDADGGPHKEMWLAVQNYLRLNKP